MPIRGVHKEWPVDHGGPASRGAGGGVRVDTVWLGLYGNAEGSKSTNEIGWKPMKRFRVHGIGNGEIRRQQPARADSRARNKALEHTAEGRGRLS